MRKHTKIFIVISGMIVLIAIVWVALVFYSFTGVRQYTPKPIYSTDGLKAIFPTINYSDVDPYTYLCVNFEIRDIQSGKSLYTVQTHASDRMRWSFHWTSNDFIKLDSSDIGTYCWKEKNGKWGETQCP
jgi:hypothetical protein